MVPELLRVRVSRFRAVLPPMFRMAPDWTVVTPAPPMVAWPLPFVTQLKVVPVGMVRLLLPLMVPFCRVKLAGAVRSVLKVTVAPVTTYCPASARLTPVLRVMVFWRNSRVPVAATLTAPARVPPRRMVLPPLTWRAPPLSRTKLPRSEFRPTLFRASVPPLRISSTPLEVEVRALTVWDWLTFTVTPPPMVALSLTPGTPGLLVWSCQFAAVLKSPPEGPTQVKVDSSERSSRASTARRRERRGAGRFVDFVGRWLPNSCQNMQDLVVRKAT